MALFRKLQHEQPGSRGQGDKLWPHAFLDRCGCACVAARVRLCGLCQVSSP